VTGDGSGWLWDRTGGLRRLVGPDVGLNDARFSPDGAGLATVGDDGALVMWDAAAGTPVGRFERAGTELTNVAFSPDGRTLAVTGHGDADGGEVLLLDAATLALRHRWAIGAPGPDGATDDTAAGVAFSPDGRLVAVPLFAGRVDILDTADPGAAVRSVDGHAGLATDAQFAPDGAVLATAGADRSVRLWRVSDGREIGTFESVSAVRAVAFSPDGNLLAAASQDTVLRLWDVRSRQPLALIDRHVQSLNDVAFDEDGRLISAAADGLAMVWDLDPDGAARELCRVLDPATIADQWRQLGPDPGEPPRCAG
jgi:WD40 repeat protein